MLKNGFVCLPRNLMSEACWKDEPYEHGMAYVDLLCLASKGYIKLTPCQGFTIVHILK